MKQVDFAGDGAVISDCGAYRYRLDRHVGTGTDVYAFFGVNPSTADASINDATVRKWLGFTSRLGAKSFIVGNVFGWRATDVKQLDAATDPMGRENRAYIREIASEADIIVPCWGASGKLPPRLRYELKATLEILAMTGKPLMCWGKTASGEPKHPLMLPYTTPLEVM